jgi:hypothetical protein
MPSVGTWRAYLAVGAVLTLLLMAVVADSGGNPDTFTGLCISSSGSFSLLTDGSRTLAVYTHLSPGTVYRVEGVMRKSKSGWAMNPVKVVRTSPAFPLERIRAAYWPSRGCYLLTPEKIRLGWCLHAEKGAILRLRGLWYGNRFYVVEFTSEGFPWRPRDGMPWTVEGVVLSSGRRTILWNGSEEIVLYLPYGTRLTPGTRVRVEGIVRFYSRLSILVDSKRDVEVTGRSREAPVNMAGVGDIATGTCTVTSAGRGLALNCTSLPLYGFSAKPGDVVKIEALKRRSSLLCINCRLLEGRETLPNGICGFEPGNFAKIRGRVKWVRVYRNGFGLANITKDDCWVLLKLRKSLGVHLSANETLTAYGTFTTYRGLRAFEVQSGDDLCSGNC